MPKAVIFGCEGPAVTDWEKDFFAREQPYGFVLFARNCRTPDQIRSLVGDLKGLVAHEEAPVLIDQEGGRVARLGPPNWRRAPAAPTGCSAACSWSRACCWCSAGCCRS